MNRWLVISTAVGSLLVLGAWANWPRAPLADGVVADRVVVRKSDRVLEVYSGGTLLRSYSVSLGREPIGPKRQEGDERTPEGRYILDYRKADSSYHRALHISYPRPEEQAAAKARGTSAGGLIMIHGLLNGIGPIGRFHLAWDWTNGCIAVTDAEIEEILRVVPDGTPIEIQP